MYLYGALTEHLDEDQRADIDAILRGETPPSEIPPPPSSHDDWVMFTAAAGGTIAGGGE